LTLCREECRSSRKVGYILILSSFLALCNVAIQPVSSQAFSTVTSTQINTATYYTVSLATSNVSVTVLTEQYITSTSVFTILNVQFTTLTSFLTQIQIDQPPERAPPLFSSTRSSNSLSPRSGALPRTTVDVYVFLEYIESGRVLQLVVCLFLLSLLLIRRKK
jgi:hypothetical protein